MPFEVVIILAGLVATILIVVGALYLRYRSTPAARWKRQIQSVVREQQRRLRAAHWRLAHREKGDDKALREEFLGHDLSGLAVEELARHPGIGPVTVSRLREAGVTTVADCSRARLSGITGIGPSRRTELKDAVRQAHRDAESRFDAGASPGAVALTEELKRREVDRQRRQHDAEQNVQAAEATLAAMADQVRVARGITFLGFLRGRRPEGYTDELINRPIVEVPVEELPTLTVPAVVPLTPAPNPVDVAANATPMPVIPTSFSAANLANSLPPTETAKSLPAVDDSPLARLRVAAGFGLAVAKADGRIAASERKQIRAFLGRRYAHAPELMDRLDALLVEVEADLPTMGDALWNVRRVIPKEAWPELYQFAVSVADAAGERNAREVECLARIAEELGVGPGTAGILPASHSPVLEVASVSGELLAGRMPAVPGADNTQLSEADCRVALEITMETPLGVDLIRRQYRLLSDRFAPDKFGAHGPEFVQIATVKLDRVERAARQLLAAYNEPLEQAAAEPPADLRHNPLLDQLFGA